MIGCNAWNSSLIPFCSHSLAPITSCLLFKWLSVCLHFLFICSHYLILFWSSALWLACFCTAVTYSTPGLVSCRQMPLQIIHILGNFLRIWSIYSMYNYLSQTGASVVLFIFSCLVPASIILLLLQKPWKGRPLSNTQVKKLSFTITCNTFIFILWHSRGFVCWLSGGTFYN